MDRGKATGRIGKTRAPQLPADLYALGPKGTRVEKPEVKPTIVPPKAIPSTSGSSDRRRFGPTPPATVVPPIKKPKLTPSLPSSSISRSEAGPSTSAGTSHDSKIWESIAIPVDPSELAESVIEAKTENDPERVIALLCGAIKILRSGRSKNDSTLSTSLLLLAKTHSSVFTYDTVLTALCATLRKETLITPYKTKINIANVFLIINIFYYCFKDSKRWPDIFMRLYIEDSLAERQWVDSEHCKCFTDNIVASVNTRPSPKSDLETGVKSEMDDEFEHSVKEYRIIPRYKNFQEIENLVMEFVKDQLNRRQAIEGINKNLLKFLAYMCGITEVRATVASRLEVWLQNPKLMKTAQELLMAVCVNCTSHTQRDIEVVCSIVKIRLKTKALNGFYLSCIRELVPAHNKNLSVMLKQIIQNELSTSRNSNNMSMISTLFVAEPHKCAEILAEIFIELLMSQDSLRSLRTLLREIARVVRCDLQLPTFARALMSQTEPLPREFDQKDRVFHAIIDLITLSVFLCIVPHARSERRDILQIERMQNAIARIQSDAVCWFHESAVRIYRPSDADFIHALHKVVFMEAADQYYKMDNWPPEPDRLLFFRYATEVPLLQSTILRIMIVGISKEYPLSAPDALELTDQLVKRSASLAFTLTIPALQADKHEIVDLLFNLAVYHHPENIDLPLGYVPPQLAITNLYWKAWIILLIYCAHVPSIYGKLAWERYPMVKIMIEMCITNNFVFPQTPEELQLQAIDKQKILEFETHLAAASTKAIITEQTSLLLSQLISLEPSGPARKPPNIVLEQLQTLNTTHRIGHLLCRSRDPDFLLHIINERGTSQSMPWLADMVQNSDESFSHLPVQCLCEYLLSSSDKQDKHQLLLSHLQTLLTDPATDPAVVFQILEYFLRRLTSQKKKDQAIYGLTLLLNVIDCSEANELDQIKSRRKHSSLVFSKLSYLPHFVHVRYQVIRLLHIACQSENDPELIVSYLTFIAQYGASQDIDVVELREIVLDMAQLVVERSIIMSAIVPPCLEDEPENVALGSLIKIFYAFFSKAREPRKEQYAWSESQDQILVTWPSGEEATLYILVVHAVIILLTYGFSNIKETTLYSYLLQLWFPEERHNMPRGYLVDTSEEALLIPDWLKLKMVRSTVPRLVHEALIDLDPSQLLLFVQSFGIPIYSMTKLLHALDEYVLVKKIGTDIVLDKAYMTQLIEVQHARGASGGNIFAQLLQAEKSDVGAVIPTIVLDDVDMDSEDDVTTPDFSNEPTINEMESTLNSIHIEITRDNIGTKVRVLRQKLLENVSLEIHRVQVTSSLYQTPVLNTTLDHLNKIIFADINFIPNLLKNFHYPCRLFRILISTKHANHIVLMQNICKNILDFASARGLTKNPLITILNGFMTKTGNTESTVKPKLQLQSTNPLKALETSSVEWKEKFSMALMELEGVHKKKCIIESISNILTKRNHNTYTTGLLIDLLVQIEPEIIGSCLELQLEMLFSGDLKWKHIQQCRPYLLTLLTHHASWLTLEKAVVTLFTRDATKWFHPTSVLDFLWAVACNPKLWQGREKVKPKHQEPENMLSLTQSQLICVVEYIILEMEQEDCGSKDALERMNIRLTQLIESAINIENLHTYKEILSYLKQHQHSNVVRKGVCQYFIMQLYLRVPCLITEVDEVALCSQIDGITISGCNSSSLDTMSHMVLTNLSTDVSTREWVQRSQDLELIIRKMASTHPLLFLRQLGIIQTSLMGRVHVDWNVFRSGNHFNLFTIMIGVLTLSTPHLFSAEFSNNFHLVLDLYFDMFKKYSYVKETVSTFNKFVQLLKSYISYNSVRAVDYLKSKQAILSDLQSDYPTLRSMCILIDETKENDLIARAGIIITADKDQDMDIDDIIQSLKSDNALQVLEELGNRANKNISILEPVLEYLFPLLTDNTGYNRTIGYTLISKCVKNNPLIADRVMPVILTSLQSENPDIIKTAMDYIPELVVCAQEDALPVLRKLFLLGMTRNIDTLQCVGKTISLLNLQSGC